MKQAKKSLCHGMIRDIVSSTYKTTLPILSLKKGNDLSRGVVNNKVSNHFFKLLIQRHTYAFRGAAV